MRKCSEKEINIMKANLTNYKGRGKTSKKTLLKKMKKYSN